MHRPYKGFTIVELLIVIVVIGILAAITIVSYSGVQQRAEFARAQSDMKHIDDAIQVYRSQNGAYPTGTGGFVVASSALSSLVPSYLDSASVLTAKTGYAYFYQADTNETDYKLIRIKGASIAACATLPTAETTGNQSMVSGSSACTGKAWGYWSAGAVNW